MKTFPIGGVHPSDNKKWSCGRAIEVAELPDVVNIPLGQHIGAPAAAKVAKGDKVLTGQLIAEASSFMSANIHSPVSGTVTAVDMVPNGQGLRQMMITIKREGDEWMPEIDRTPEIKRECAHRRHGRRDVPHAREAVDTPGLQGRVPYNKRRGVRTLPHLRPPHHAGARRELLVGVEILKRALGVDKAVIGIENNKPDAIAHLRALIAEKSFAVGVEPLKVQYPQGGEKQLIAAVTGRQVPPPPGLPIHVGAVVCNASTAVAVYEAVQKNKPLIERVVTVTGKSVSEPRNLLARMGTPVAKLIEKAGGLPEGDVKVVNGGPMMGRAMVNLDSPVTKGCSGITVLSGVEARRVKESPCIKCAKCVGACPMGLEPYLISKMSRKKMWESVEGERITDCIECGCCQYSCPAGIPLLDHIRLGKQTVMGIIRARAAANAPKK